MKMVRPLFTATVVILAYVLSLSQAGSQVTEGSALLKGTRALEMLRTGDGATLYSLCTEVVKSRVTEEQLNTLWKGLEGQFGVFKGVSDSSVSRKDSLDIVELICDFEKGSLQARFVFDNKGKLTGFWFAPAPPKGAYVPPDYVRPESFTEEEVSFGLSEWKVAGTLSFPRTPSPHAVVILVHGSGPHDRDETIGPNRPFKDIAWGLASNGLAVLRYEKRTKAYAQKLTANSVTVKEEVIDDALEAIDYLSQRSDIDSKRVFLFGHSLGAMLAPQIATLSGKLAGIILAAGPARHLEDVIVDQLEYLTSLSENPTDAQKNSLVEIRENVAKLKSQTLPDTVRIIGIPASYFYDLGKRDQLQFARDLQIPILILQGERDYQVTMEDLSLWKKAIGDQPNVKIISYPDLNHLFASGKGKAKPAEYLRTGYVSRQLIDDVSGWIRENPRVK